MELDLSKPLELGLVAVFGLALGAFIVMGVILNYHWTRYETSISKIERIRLIYFGVGATIVGFMTLFLIKAIR